jgi:bacteriorhodopsin
LSSSKSYKFVRRDPTVFLMFCVTGIADLLAHKDYRWPWHGVGATAIDVCNLKNVDAAATEIADKAAHAVRSVVELLAV